MFSAFGGEKPYKRRGNAFLPNRAVFALPLGGWQYFIHVFFCEGGGGGVIPCAGERKAHKQNHPQNLGTIPRKYFLCFFVCSAVEISSQKVADFECRFPYESYVKNRAPLWPFWGEGFWGNIVQRAAKGWKTQAGGGNTP